MGRPFDVQNQPNPEETKTPILFLLGEFSGEACHVFTDPVRGEVLDVVRFPELGCQLHCLASRFGWLLLVSRESSSLFFFNPSTRQKIDLPYRRAVFDGVDFSAPPTSSDCRVFAVKDNLGTGRFLIDTLLVGQEKVWTRYAFSIGMKGLKHLFGFVKQAACDGDTLYCLDLEGRVGRFDIKSKDWKVISRDDGFVRVRLSSFLKFKEKFFGFVYKSGGVVEKIYELRFENGVAEGWEEVKDLGELTMMVGPYGSYTFSGLGENLKKKMFVACPDPKLKCLRHEAGGEKCKISQVLDCSPFGFLYAPIWVDRSS